MIADFGRCVAVTLHEEDSTGRGLVTEDAGGVTRWGIAQRYHPQLDVRNLTLEGAKAVYRAEYWDPLRCGEMPAPLAMVVFDAAVNPGQGWTGFALQQALGVRMDGKVGLETIMAARRADMETCVAFTALRLGRFMKSPTWETNKGGWTKRCFRVLYQAARMEVA